MAAKRYYYSDAISTFLKRNVNEIVGELTLASQHDINDKTSQSWVEEITTLQDILAPYSGHEVSILNITSLAWAAVQMLLPSLTE